MEYPFKERFDFFSIFSADKFKLHFLFVIQIASLILVAFECKDGHPLGNGKGLDELLNTNFWLHGYDYIINGAKLKFYQDI